MPQGLRGRSVRAGWRVALGLVGGLGLTGCMTPEKKPAPAARQVGPGPAASGPNAKLGPGPVSSTLPGLIPTSGTQPGTSAPVTPAAGTRPTMPSAFSAPQTSSQYQSQSFEHGLNQIPAQMTPAGIKPNQASFQQGPAGFTPAYPQSPPAPGGVSWNDRPPALKKPTETAAAPTPPPPPSGPPVSVVGLPPPSVDVMKLTDVADLVPPPAPTAMASAAPAPTPPLPATGPGPVAPSPPDGVFRGK